jgi:phage gp29-like protein
MSLFDTLRSWLTRRASRSQVALGPGLTIEDLPLYAQYQRIGGSLTPEQVTDALRMADVGTMWPLVTLANDARRKDGHLQSILGTREMALPSLPWEVSAGGPRRRDQKVADWMAEALQDAWGGREDDSDLVGLRALIAHLQGGVYHGYALAETVYERSGGKLWPKGWNPVGAYRVQFDPTTGRPHWYDPVGTIAYPGVDIRRGFAPGKVIFYQPRVNGDDPQREGLSRVLLWAALFRNWSVRDWVMLGELAWKPWRIGEYEPDADKSAIDRLQSILRQMTATGVAMLPARTKLRVEWPAGNKQDSTHHQLAEFLAGEMSKATLGQTLTTEAGPRGARALGQVHNLVRGDILSYDAACVAECLRRDLIGPLVRRNFGPDVAIPVFRFLTEEGVDLRDFSTGVTTLARGGLRIPSAWVRERIGIPEPADGEEIMSLHSLAPGEVDVPIDPDTGLPAEPDEPDDEDPTDPPDDAPEE